MVGNVSLGNGPKRDTSQASVNNGFQTVVRVSSGERIPLRGPAAILFISRDTLRDSIAKLFCASF